jgi:hypothetical protein
MKDKTTKVFLKYILEVVTPLDIENAQKVIANFTPYHTYLLKGYRM